MSKFCYLGDTLGSGGGVMEAARARVRCAWAKFKKLSPILTVRVWMIGCLLAEGWWWRGTRGWGRSRKTLEQCVRDDMKLLGLHPEWAVFKNK